MFRLIKFYKIIRKPEKLSAYQKRLIGGVFEHGAFGIKKSEKKATSWYLKAAEEGDVHAMGLVGRNYFAGYQDGKQRITKQIEALYWLTKGARAGGRVAQAWLGYLYHNNGNATSADLKRAYYWYSQAAKQGDPLAEFYLYEMYKFGDYVKKDDEKEIYYLKRSASRGFPLALNYLSHYSSLNDLAEKVLGENENE